MKYVVLLGRIFYTAIFITSGFNHFSPGMADYAASMGVPAASFWVPVSGALIVVGGLNILFGYRAKASAWLIVLFLAPVTLMMHNFWSLTDPQAAMQQQIHFMKNLAMLGGALLIAYFGAGPVSLDERRERREVLRRPVSRPEMAVPLRPGIGR
jgi:putative oxidoreductase